MLPWKQAAKRYYSLLREGIPYRQGFLDSMTQEADTFQNAADEMRKKSQGDSVVQTKPGEQIAKYMSDLAEATRKTVAMLSRELSEDLEEMKETDCENT